MQDDSEEVDRSTAEKAGALAESIRTLISRTADERLENLNVRLAETQSSFEAALQQLQFVDAAYHLQQLRKEVEDEQSAAGVHIFPAVAAGLTQSGARTVQCGLWC